MNFATFTKSLRTHTGTDDVTLPKETIAAFVNSELEGFSILATLPNLQETYLGKTIPMNLANDTREYTIPNNVIRTHNIEINYGGIWVRMKEISLERMDAAINEEEVQKFFKNRLPMYSIYGGKYYIWTPDPITELIGWLKIYASVYPTEFDENDFEENNIVEMSEVNELPRQFHQVLQKRVIISYKESRDKPIPLTQSEQMYKGDLETVLKSMRVINTARRYKMSEPKDWFYWSSRDPFEWNSQDLEMLLVDGDWVFLTV